MGAYLIDELVIAAEDKSRYFGCRVGRNDSFDEGTAQTRQTEIEEIGVGIVQIALQGGNIYLCGHHALVEHLVIDDIQKGRRMHAVRRAHLLNRLVSHSHLQPETADDLYRIFLVRHQIAYLITTLVHTAFFCKNAAKLQKKSHMSKGTGKNPQK